MSWRIREVAVYPKTGGAPERIEIPTSGLSIITGRQGRGKSSILDIVDYCLLSDGCRVPKGRIRDTVARVALLLEGPAERLGIIRPLPAPGKVRSTEVTIIRGPGVNLPDSAPEERSNVDFAKEVLSEFTGIESVPMIEASDGTSTRKLPANIRHCVCYISQPQDVVANRNVSFPGLTEYWAKRHTAESSDYFLGVISAEVMTMRTRLAELKQRRKELERQRREHELARNAAFSRARALWNEVVALGMIPGEPVPNSVGEILRLLSKAGDFEVVSVEQAVKLADHDALLAREADLRAKLHRIEHELSSIRQLQNDARRATEAVDRQLGFVGIEALFPVNNRSSCPMCGSKEFDLGRHVEHLRVMLDDLGESKAAPVRLSGRLAEAQKSVEEVARKLRSELRDVQARLDIVLRHEKARARLTEEVRRRVDASARARELVGVLRDAARSSFDDWAELETEIKALEEAVGAGAIAAKRRSMQEDVGRLLTANAQRLGVEFAEQAFRMNFEAMRFEVGFGSGWVGLDEIGSGANWVGYHVAGAVGIQQFFATNNRPVPRVLLLDQPSQVWFPHEPVREGITVYKDRDLDAVRDLYQFLFTVARSSGVQIIVVDHARLRAPWFQQSTLRDWHEQGGLIPDSWEPKQQ